MKPIGTDLLPPGWQTEVRDGLYVELHPDGQLAHVGVYRQGRPVGWVLGLDPANGQGLLTREQNLAFVEGADGSGETLHDWARVWIPLITGPDGGSRTCDFCGKHQHEVRKLIAGPTSFICDECVALCHAIVQED